MNKRTGPEIMNEEQAQNVWSHIRHAIHCLRDSNYMRVDTARRSREAHHYIKDASQRVMRFRIAQRSRRATSAA